jgi:hypothetical protein
VGRPAINGLRRRRRRKQWWKAFASPKLMVIAIPALLCPIGAAMVLRSQDVALTPVEQTIDTLPSAGNAAPADDGGADASPLGAGTQRLSPSAAMPLFAASARATSAMLALRDSAQAARPTDHDYTVTEFSLLHPDELARDNMLIGDLGLVYNNPTGTDLSARIFQAYCAARPGDPFYAVNIDTLPITPALKQAAMAWQEIPGATGRCPHVTG